MIKLKEIKKYGYCNVCQTNKDKTKFYELEFINPINQGMVVGLCESCLNDLTMKLLRKEIDNDDK